MAIVYLHPKLHPNAYDDRILLQDYEVKEVFCVCRKVEDAPVSLYKIHAHLYRAKTQNYMMASIDPQCVTGSPATDKLKQADELLKECFTRGVKEPIISYDYIDVPHVYNHHDRQPFTLDIHINQHKGAKNHVIIDLLDKYELPIFQFENILLLHCMRSFICDIVHMIGCCTGDINPLLETILERQKIIIYMDVNVSPGTMVRFEFEKFEEAIKKRLPQQQHRRLRRIK